MKVIAKIVNDLQPLTISAKSSLYARQGSEYAFDIIIIVGRGKITSNQAV